MVLYERIVLGLCYKLKHLDMNAIAKKNNARTHLIPRLPVNSNKKIAFWKRLLEMPGSNTAFHSHEICEELEITH